MEAEEAALNAAVYRAEALSRPKVSTGQVSARLIAASEPPTLEEIKPYREALVVNLYEVTQDTSNLLGSSKKIQVVHWAILDGRPLPSLGYKPDEIKQFVLEPYESNPQLEGLYRSNTLPVDDDSPVFFDVSLP
jgi:hypothetical protein